MTHNTTPHKAEYAQVAERLTLARMAHYGYTPDQIAAAELVTHESAGCEFDGNHMRWVCTDENEEPLHPVRDEWDATAEWVCWVLDNLPYRPGLPESPGLSCSALWSRNQGVSCCVDTPHTVHRGSSEPDAPSWGDGECVPGTLTAGRGGR